MGGRIHDLAGCIQGPTLKNIEKKIDSLDENSNRTATALEKIAAQGVMVENHERRLNKHDKEFDEVFGRLRRVELKDAQEQGREIVENKKERFWTEVKLKLLPYLLLAFFFILWLCDRLGIFEALARFFKEMKG